MRKIINGKMYNTETAEVLDTSFYFRLGSSSPILPFLKKSLGEEHLHEVPDDHSYEERFYFQATLEKRQTKEVFDLEIGLNIIPDLKAMNVELDQYVGFLLPIITFALAGQVHQLAEFVSAKDLHFWLKGYVPFICIHPVHEARRVERLASLFSVEDYEERYGKVEE